jgi:hypothetical protein
MPRPDRKLVLWDHSKTGVARYRVRLVPSLEAPSIVLRELRLAVGQALAGARHHAG